MSVAWGAADPPKVKVMVFEPAPSHAVVLVGAKATVLAASTVDSPAKAVVTVVASAFQGMTTAGATP